MMHTTPRHRTSSHSCHHRLAAHVAEVDAVCAQLPQAFGSRQAQKPSSQEPDEITVVKVQQSLANPDIERVQVRRHWHWCMQARAVGGTLAPLVFYPQRLR